MTQIKKIWQKTFLGKLFKTDPIFVRVLSILLVVYVFIHIFRLELYPMYMYAMFSKKETPKELYHVYKIYDQGQEVEFSGWNFRKYTVLMNTIGQYDAILSNEMNHPEAEAIDKFINRLRLDKTGIKKNLKKSFSYSKPALKEHFGTWIGNELDIAADRLIIQKASYTWDKSLPKLYRKVILYEHDQ